MFIRYYQSKKDNSFYLFHLLLNNPSQHIVSVIYS